MELGSFMFLGRIIEKLLQLNTQRKKEVAAYLDEIAKTIDEFPAAIRAGASIDELGSLTSQTEGLARRFAKSTSDVLPEAESDELIFKLMEAFNAKNLLTQGGGANGEQQLLKAIGETAGTFKAAAKSLRASASKFG